MHAREVKLQDGKCIPVSCDPGYTISDITGQCEEQEEDEDQLCLPNELKELNATFGNKNTGKCIPTKCMEQYELSGNKCKKMSDKDICEKISMGTWKNKKCQCDDKTQNMVNGKCVDDDKKIELKRSSDDAMANIQASIDKESQKQVQACTDSGGTWDDKKKSPCSCSKQKGLTDDIKGFTCKCQMNGYEYDKQSNKCTKQTSSNNNNNNNKQSASATNKDTEASTQAKIDELRQQRHKQQCEKTGGTWEGEGCSCYTSKGITPESSYTCKCIKTGYIFQNGKCTKQTSSNNTTNQQSASATNKDTEDELLQQLRDNQKKHCKETGGTWDNNKCIKKSSTTTTQQAVKTRPMTKEEALEQTLSMTAANQSMMYLNSINETKSFCDVANKKCGFVYVNQNTERGALFCCKVDKIEQTNDGYSIQGQECQVRMFANIKDPNKFANKYSIASCSPQEFPDLY